MKSKKAWMRAARDICGISQHDVASAVDVAERTVRRWEKPGENEPPDDVVAWLTHALEEHRLSVNEYVEMVVKRVSPGSRVLLDWYANQEQRDIEGGDVPYTFSNAITRSAAERLVDMGYKVEFAFPNEEVVAVDMNM
jgi:transcriptional regulator with XRE-family HTH domain